MSRAASPTSSPWPCSSVLWEPGRQVVAPPGLVSVGKSLSPETGPGLVGEVCPRSPPEGPDGPGTGLAPCSRLGPKQGRAEREAPRVGTEPLQSQLRSSTWCRRPPASVEGSPGLGSDPVPTTSQLRDVGRRLSSPSLCLKCSHAICQVVELRVWGDDPGERLSTAVARAGLWEGVRRHTLLS